MNIDFLKSLRDLFSRAKACPVEEAIDRRIFGIMQSVNNQVFIVLDNGNHIEIYVDYIGDKRGMIKIANNLGCEIFPGSEFVRCIHR